MSMTMTLRPRVSEKAYGLSQVVNTYVIEVPKDANKLTVARAVAAQFKVTVVEVNISNLKGKAKRTIRKGGRATAGRDVAVKKAYVKLKAGDTLPIFATEDKADEKKPAAKEKK
jgi:large subunit ribosomal protein L23